MLKNRVVVDLLDVDYLSQKNLLFVPDKRVQIEVTFEDTAKTEFKQIGYNAFVQWLLYPFAKTNAKLLAQSTDGYPPRFIWYQRMDFSDIKQDVVRNLNLLMPTTEDAMHVTGQHFAIDSSTMLKLYLYPEEEYYMQFEMLDPGALAHISNVPDAFFKR